jgi:hypothetical protein
MRSDDLNELPEWDDGDLKDEDEEGEDWKPDPTRDLWQIIRDEIDKFRELFKQWVASFEKDEYEDDWGLFV